MSVLDQSDIDSLLASASALEEDAEPGDVGEARPSGPPRAMPADFRLSASTSELERILAIRVPVTVRLAERTMSVERILELTVGTIIEFDRLADSELDLIANNMPIGTGDAVKYGENFGLRVIRIEPWAQRLIAMGLFR